MNEKEMDKLIKKVEELIEYNASIKEHELRFKKHYRNVPTEPVDIIFLQEM